MNKSLLLLLIAGGLFLYSRRSEAIIMRETDSTPLANSTRGERNNNPGNIRISASAWQGKIDSRDSSFETFTTPFYGIRATAVLLRNYQFNYGLKTVREIINRWAPPNENNTTSYVNAVASALRVNPDQQINLDDDFVLTQLVKAVIKHENGRVIYSDTLIGSAVKAA